MAMQAGSRSIEINIGVGGGGGGTHGGVYWWPCDEAGRVEVLQNKEVERHIYGLYNAPCLSSSVPPVK